jgi:hypothetical protein
MALVEVFDRLFKANRDEQADDDRGDMYEETLPGVDGFM